LLISVIIVSYNVRYFLEQCLFSVRKAMLNVNGEVIVVDNASTDDTRVTLPVHFTEMKWIFNSTNAGFAKANNQAFSEAEGKYIVFLNPDTIIPENYFEELIRFMDAHPLAGACGVRMIDGTGNFLKESKRGLPTPWASFCKMTGLSDAFPTSRFLSQYYLGHLDKNEFNIVDALSGACLFARKEVLQKFGAFDERFFMYAEDIDLSISIQHQGFLNYYLPSPVIIHFKGESTRKDWKYIQMFYKAMDQFLDKHQLSHTGFLQSFLKAGVNIKTRWEAVKLRRKILNNKQDSNPEPVRLSILGDDESCIEVKNSDISIENPENGDRAEKEIVLCEGAQYPFKMIIALISSMPGQKYWIHARGSSALISSQDKDQQGKAIALLKREN